MYIDLEQYLHLVVIVVVGLHVISHYVCWFIAMPSLVVLDTTLQEVLLPIQDEHGDVMEDNE